MTEADRAALRLDVQRIVDAGLGAQLTADAIVGLIERLAPSAAPNAVEPDDLVDADVIAELLHVTPSRVLQLAREYRLPAIRIGERRVRFSRRAVERFLASGGGEVPDDVRDVKVGA